MQNMKMREITNSLIGSQTIIVVQWEGHPVQNRFQEEVPVMPQRLEKLRLKNKTQPLNKSNS
jgi:hypothetical protein